MHVRQKGVMTIAVYDPDKDGRIEKDALEITLNKLLKGAGAGANPSEIDVPGVFDKFREFIPWVSPDGFTAVADTGGGVTFQTARVILDTGPTTDYDAQVRTLEQWVCLLDAGKLIIVEFIIINLTTITDQNIWLRLSQGVADPPSETIDHFGWKIIGADLYASNADGTTQNITDTTVNLSTGHQRTRLKAVLNPGTDCKFYVNDVLKVTHTENLPDALEYYLHAHIRTLADAAIRLGLGRVLIEKEHA